MDFLIADTFSDSLARLTGDEQKAVKTTAFDLQMDPSRRGLSFHRLDRARDKNFWSVRVNSDIRIIVHRTPGSLLLCYVDHHDQAYAWGERRKLETHPKTGAAQLVEIREAVREIVVPIYVQEEVQAPPRPGLLRDRSEDELLGYGIPEEWVADVREADEDTLLALAERLPAEAAEAVLELATGGRPRVHAAEYAAPFEHPDAQRRFRVVANVEELERALDFPWEKWTVFLHPEQRAFVERDFNGPARVSGSAGTGKTIVALHRAVHLARSHPDARILLATFSEPLARALRIKLKRLIGNEPRVAEGIEVHALGPLGLRLFSALRGSVSLVDRETLREVLLGARVDAGAEKFTERFLLDEWDQVVDAWQLDTWDAYRDVQRLGRRTRLPQSRREALWSVFVRVRATLAERGLATQAGLFHALATDLAQSGRSPYDFTVVDEAQDVSVSELRFFAALGADRPNALFFAGDLGQRIFRAPFSWTSLGVDIRGRSHTLRVNYRTSHQIRAQADRLLGPEVVDVDGNREARSDTISVFNGPPPKIDVLASEEDEVETVGGWLAERREEGVVPGSVGVFVRSEGQIERARRAVAASGYEAHVLDDDFDLASDRVAISTMHLAKGLEFGAVAVMACDDEVVPLQERIEAIGDDADLKEVYDTERHLLYVACTRARDRLLVTGVHPASEFLEDLTF